MRRLSPIVLSLLVACAGCQTLSAHEQYDHGSQTAPGEPGTSAAPQATAPPQLHPELLRTCWVPANGARKRMSDDLSPLTCAEEIGEAEHCVKMRGWDSANKRWVLTLMCVSANNFPEERPKVIVAPVQVRQ